MTEKKLVSNQYVMMKLLNTNAGTVDYACSVPATMCSVLQIA